MLPRITIVTPSYQQGKFIGETLDSILSQGYPNLELIVIDGGSTDESVDVIKQYARHLAFWVSERDGGQSDALNRGFARATGELFAYMNSDDLFLPGALSVFAEVFRSGVEWAAAPVVCIRTGEADWSIDVLPDQNEMSWFRLNLIPQPGCFWSARLHKLAGPFREDLKYVFDYEFWLRLRLRHGASMVRIPEKLAVYRFHEESKTVSAWPKFEEEFWQVRMEYRPHLTPAGQAELQRDFRHWRAHRHQMSALDAADQGRLMQGFVELARSFVVDPRLVTQRRSLGVIKRIVGGSRRIG